MKQRKRKAVTAPLAPTERAWKIAQLAAVLASKTHVQPGQKETLYRNNRMVELGWAVQQAEALLAAAEYAGSIRYAYQLFDSGLYTAEQAARIFRAQNWPRLRSWHSVENLLGEIIKELRAMCPKPTAGEQRVSEQQAPDTESLASELGFELPDREPPEDALFWPGDPDRLREKRQGKKVYRVRAILLAAHYYLHERFKDRIERLVWG